MLFVDEHKLTCMKACFKCMDVRFNPARRCAVALWGSNKHPSSGTMLVIYRLVVDGKVYVQDDLVIECAPRWYSFNPKGNHLIITTIGGILLYDIAETSSPPTLREMTTKEIEQCMNIKFKKRDDGKASPPSTKQTVSSEVSGMTRPTPCLYFRYATNALKGQTPLYFSVCGTYLYNNE
jgi:hypothetical protein